VAWSKRQGDRIQQLICVSGATRYRIVFSKGACSFLLGSLGCLVLGVASQAFLLELELGASLSSGFIVSFNLLCKMVFSPSISLTVSLGIPNPTC
jgi:hypothetical protein